MGSFFIVLRIYSELNSKDYLPLASALSIAPGIYFSFFSGRLIDKFSAKLTVLAAMVIYLISILNITWLELHDQLGLPWLLAFICIQSVVSGTIAIAISAIIPELFNRDKLRLAYASYSFISGSAMTFSPALAGVLYGGLEFRSLILMLLFFTLIFFFFIMCYMPASQKNNTKPNVGTTSYLSELVKSGLHRFSFFYAFINALNGLSIILVPLYILKMFNDNHLTLAMVSSFIAFSSLFGVLVSAKSFPVQNHIVIGLTTLFGALLGRIFIPMTEDLIMLCILFSMRGIALEVGNMANQMEWIDRTNEKNRAGMLGLRRLFGQGLYPIISISFSIFALLIGVDLNTDFINVVFLVSGIFEVAASIIFLIVLNNLKATATTTQ